MKATDLNKDDVVSISCGAMFADQLVVIHGIDSLGGHFVAVGSDLEDGSTVVVSHDSDYTSLNGSPIGSWHRLSAAHAQIAIAMDW